MNREVPSLFTTILKTISKQPAKFLTTRNIQKSGILAFDKNNVNVIQLLVDFITEAGRFTDEAISCNLFQHQNVLCFKNAKISGRYLLNTLNLCGNNLKSIDVSGCFQIDDESVSTIISMCSEINTLSLRNCRKITSKSLNSLVECTDSKIIKFDIGGNFNITKDGLNLFFTSFRNCSALTELNISGLAVDNEILNSVANSCCSLTVLGIAYADVGEEAINYLISKLGYQLKRLNISWLSTYPGSINAPIGTSNFTEVIPMSCPKLTEIDVSGLRFLGIVHLMHMIELKIIQAQARPLECFQIQVLTAKFISGTKASIETAIGSAYPFLTVHA